jgi:hypothetical protein
MAARGGRNTPSGRKFFLLFEEGEWQELGEKFIKKLFIFLNSTVDDYWFKITIFLGTVDDEIREIYARVQGISTRSRRGHNRR